MTNATSHDTSYDTALAIVGMSGRFPGAGNIEEFWRNVAGGIKSVRFFSDAELLAADIDPAVLRQPNYVKAGGVLENVDSFDAAFFGYTRREAELLDPQHRLFMEAAWEALEDAAYEPQNYPGLIGIFAGCGFSTYLANNLYYNAPLKELVSQFQIDIGNEHDSLVSAIAYRFNLKGPSVAVQTFCSTSLVAVHMACQSLFTYECDIALAGGVAITVPQRTGYIYEEGGILSPDGECRTFDMRAQGSVMGDGLGVVVLKRFSDALEDGDHIYALIRGSAVNSSGSTRVSYTAPGLSGQKEVIAEALGHAGVDVETIGYIEAHGTATPIGDAVELAAMIKAFEAETSKKQFCAIGSVKPNVGHLDRASGVTGLIKTALALTHKQLPPSINFERSNPDLGLEQSPFFVNTTLRDWTANQDGSPRRAGVSSFGLGGVNAHIVLEEAPLREPSGPSRPWQLLLLSAKTETALQAANKRLAICLQEHRELPLADVAYTLQVGRGVFNHRRALVCSSSEEAIAALATPEGPEEMQRYQTYQNRQVALLLADEGEISLAHVQELYRQEALFARHLDVYGELLRDLLKLDLSSVLFPSDALAKSSQKVNRLLFLGAEYALTRLLLEWGVRPRLLFGQGKSEFLVGCLCGVFSLDAALTFLLGNEQQIQKLASSLQLREPELPFFSNLTATWITPEQATSLDYWLQLREREPEASSAVLPSLLFETEDVILTPGAAHSALQHLEARSTGGEAGASHDLLSAWPSLAGELSAQAYLLTTLGKLWLAGVSIDWQQFSAGEQRQRVSLVGYPFERKRYWIEPPEEITLPGRRPKAARGKKPDIADWFYVSKWQEAAYPAPSRVQRGPYLIFIDEAGVGEQLADRLEREGCSVVRVLLGQQFARLEERVFCLRPGERADYREMCDTLSALNLLPALVLHCWSILSQDARLADGEAFRILQERGFYSLLFLAQALDASTSLETVRIFAISDGAQAVTATEQAQPAKAMLLGACKVIAQEYMNIATVSIDLPAFNMTESADIQIAQALNYLLAEIASSGSDAAVAYRAGQRRVQSFEARRLEAPASKIGSLRQNGVYLITGGLGKVGLVLAAYLARSVNASLVLVSRSVLPERSTWNTWVVAHKNNSRESEIVRALQSLEAMGTQVMVVRADVADAEQFAGVVQQARERFGTLHGVFHAAGVSDEKTFQVVQEIDPLTCEQHFRPKVYGLLALEKALAELPLDFCVLFSSISAVLGGLGFAAYVAANLFMDAFAQRHNQQEQSATPWISINWDAWKLGETESVLGGTVAEYAMTPEEGAEALTRILANEKLTSVIVSSGDLPTRIRQWISLETLQEDPLASQSALAVTGPIAGREDYERRLVEIWKQVLGLEQVSLYDNFFDLGGNSLTGLQLVSKIRKIFRVQMPVVALFEAPTISSMASYLQARRPGETACPEPLREQSQRRIQARQKSGRQEIAIIGMSGRFPGAPTIAQFWQNLRAGRESIRFFSREELLAAGVEQSLLENPQYVPARPVLAEIEEFDAAFFGYSPREAELLDPQHRLFLENSWQALEDAGYNPRLYPGLIGVFGGANISSYLHTLIRQPELISPLTALFNDQQVAIATDRDSLTTTVSYRFNLRGPSFAVQTFCSTSLVAVHLACQSLRAGECDLALAGGVSIRVPSVGGHLYQEGDMESPDGHVRAFDAQARGTLFGDGVGVVVLKRLDEALADGDHIYAVVKGSAINNDGSLKVSYAAPSVAGQAEVITEALALAQVDAESISYVEAHGSATPLGDPIEVAALTRAYRTQTDRVGYCGLGSVKTNVGHLDRAAGIASLIKAVLALQHKELPPSLHYQTPNAEIDFLSSPFYVNTRLLPWERGATPRRAGVNSLGMGGTNVHMIIEEAPRLPPSSASRPWQLLLLSARSASALDVLTDNLAAYLRQNQETPLPDVAYTLQVGRQLFEHRRFLLCRDNAEALALLTERSTPSSDRYETYINRPVAFLLPDLDTYSCGLGRELYRREEFFHALVDRCCAILKTWIERDLREEFFLAPLQEKREHETGLLRHDFARRTRSWLAMFIIEYALASLLIQWGMRPVALLSHGLGEYVAACLSGVLSLEDALMLLARFALPLQELPQEIMQDIELSQQSEQVYLEALSDPLFSLTGKVKFNLPEIPYISSCSGSWISGEQATSREYWASHVRPAPSPGIESEAFLPASGQLLLVIGPQCQLLVPSEQTDAASASGSPLRLDSLPAVGASLSEDAFLLTTLGRLWQAGVQIDWASFSQREQRRRVSLPAYPFERQRYWLLPDRLAPLSASSAPSVPGESEKKAADLADWFYLPTWTRSALPTNFGVTDRQCWLLFVDECGLGERLAQQLSAISQDVVIVTPEKALRRYSESMYSIAPLALDDYQTLLRELRSRGKIPRRVVHLWSVTPSLSQISRKLSTKLVERSFSSLLLLAQALGNLGLDNCDLDIISSEMQDVTGVEELCPEKAMLLGPCKGIAQEYPGIRCRSIDIAFSHLSSRREDSVVAALLDELLGGRDERMVALRGRHRWTQSFERLRLSKDPLENPFRERGVYLITGGLGGLGLELALYLARTARASLVLTARTLLPPRQTWDELLRREGKNTALGRKISKIRELEALGAEVLIMQADVSDEEQMRTVVRQTLATFGTLHGVLHTAGVPASGLMQLKTLDAALQVLAPKVSGVQVLERVLQGLTLDFLVLFSSLSSITGGGPGQVDYCAANAFLDAYARAHASQHGKTVAIDWGEWQWDAWDAGLEGYPPEAQAYFRERRQQFGISFTEGMEALRRILCERLAQVVVCTEDFPAMLERNQQTSIATIIEEIQAFRQSQRQRQDERARVALYTRPALETPYAAPENEIERQIVAIWEELLGIEQIGTADNFFELGGHSLIGTQLITRLRRAFQVDIRLATLFETPTIAELAVEIELLLIEEIERMNPQESGEEEICAQKTSF